MTQKVWIKLNILSCTEVNFEKGITMKNRQKLRLYKTFFKIRQGNQLFIYK